MIQEKDFLYRVPVKNVLVTTPRQQVRNPEILVDLEGGEFMHGNILDANSTNKLINKSVKDAVDNKLIESGYVTQDLLDAETTRATEQENSLKTLIGAETSARTKGDESLSAKIKAEQTRAEGKEKEISDKLAIVDGDSNTEGSFRKAIADVIAAAPEDLDTLKEIADKLADNDDLHTALNQAITDKADASALLNEVTRATGAESALQTAIDTKADATSLSNYVLTAALNKQIDTLNTAISAKQDAGNYIPYDASTTGSYQVDKTLLVEIRDNETAVFGPNSCIMLKSGDTNTMNISYSVISLKNNNYSFVLDPSQIAQVGVSHKFNVDRNGVRFSSNGGPDYTMISTSSFFATYGTSSIDITPTSIVLTDDGDTVRLGRNGITLPDGDNDHVLTSNGSTINMANYLKESDVSGQFAAKADRSDLMALEQKVTANTTAIAGKQDKGNYMEYSSKDDDGYTIDCELNTSEPITVDGGTGYLTYVTQSGIETHDSNGRQSNLTVTSLSIASDLKTRTTYTINGITATQYNDCLATSDGSFKPISDFVLKDDAGEEYVQPSELNEVVEDVATLTHEVSTKQRKITVNSVDVTNLETADITQLRAIVKDLLTALSNSGLIRQQSGLE